MSPLLKGTENVRKNIVELQTGEMSEKRRKAIKTYAKNHDMKFKDAKFKMSLIIAKAKAK